jgi:hypothetical protein
VLLSAALIATPCEAQDSVRIRRAGPGRAGELARSAAAAPHDLLVADTGRVTLPRGTVQSRSVLIVGGDAAVGARVQGDVVVIGGDLFMHPGGAIDGRAIALGGCVYTSTLATIAGDVECVRDVRFDMQRRDRYVDVSYVTPREEGGPAIAVPFPAGLRVPTYTRVDGLGLHWGPRAVLANGALEIDPTLVYRSATGEIDPQLRLVVGAGALWFAELHAGRGTRTNDAWIRDDLLNSVIALFAGRDVRNYYRSRFATARGGRRWERGATVLSAWIGGQTERDRSTRARAPWSAFNRRDSVEGMARLNPGVTHGDVSSGLVGGGATWERDGIEFSANVETEFVIDAPDDAQFVQTTAHIDVAFTTFGAQRLVFETHGVLTSGDRAVPQRFAYLGGSGTIPTRDLLSLGGDQLLFVESRYEIPIERLTIPIAGPPVIMFRHLMGSAGLDSLPDLVQNVGVRLSIRPLRLDFAHDPASGDNELKLGVSFGR